jgi:ATP-dependent RNA helicase RhlB
MAAQPSDMMRSIAKPTRLILMQNSENGAGQKDLLEQSQQPKPAEEKIENSNDVTAAPVDDAVIEVAPSTQENETQAEGESVTEGESVAADKPEAESTPVVEDKSETEGKSETEDTPAVVDEAEPVATPVTTEVTPLTEDSPSESVATESEPEPETAIESQPAEAPAPAADEVPTLDKELSADKEPAADKEPSAETAPATQAEPAEETVEAVPAEEKPEVPKVAFSEFDLEPALAKAIEKMGFTHCTPIQAQSLRYTLRGYDVTGKAQTGTGKTAAFLITLINDMLKNPIKETRYAGEPRAIVLAPTRELVIQIASDADLLCQGSGLNVITLVGGEDYAKQLKAVDKAPVDIIVATPGRLIDFLQHEHLYLGLVELLVIDEADRMLDMGFIPQVRNIVARTPHKDCRQTLLFSATFTPEILDLTTRWAMDPVMIEIEPERVATDTIEQIVYLVTSEDKYKLLYNLVSLQGSEKVIIFSNRRDQVRKLADNLHRNGIDCGMLSGEIAQKKRIKTLEDFRTGNIKVLVATDVAGRGLHIDDVTHVINYTLPEEAEDYVHRIGRTGRAGASGTSISFACEEDSFLLPNIEDKLGQKLRCVHPDTRLLADAPEFSRASHFKEEGKGGKSGRSGKGGGGSRSRSGSRPRNRNS